MRLPLLVHTEDGSYKQGEEFEKEFSDDDETTNIESGLLEIVPQKYRVVGDSRVNETDPGGEFETALRLGQERFLVEAGHIERVVTEKPKQKKKREAK